MQASQIIEIFNRTFLDTYQTRLVGDADEPFYEASGCGGGAIYFCHDYVASALHEVAHWCVAGEKRRRQNDYGYWYCGIRGEQQQCAFETVEARPQALEWVFSRALGIPFKVSADNLQLPEYNLDPFRHKVRLALEQQLNRGLPKRAIKFAAALAELGQGDGYGYDRIEFFPELPN